MSISDVNKLLTYQFLTLMQKLQTGSKFVIYVQTYLYMHFW